MAEPVAETIEIISVEAIIFGIFAGVLIAVCVIGYKKLFLGRFVKALLKEKAFIPLDAKSFAELGIKENFLYKYALRKNGVLRIVVFEDDVEKGKYYIPENKKYRAERAYGGIDVDPLMLMFIVIVLFIAFAIASIFLPGFINGIING